MAPYLEVTTSPAPQDALSGDSTATHDLEVTFRRLADTWLDETGHFSVVRQMVAHPAYQQIVGLGTPVIPLILRELQREPAPWFSALRSLTAVDPTRPGSNFDQAREAWLRWGRERGYLE